VTCWFGTSTDITEHLETEARLQKALAAAEEGQRTLETLLEYIPEGIALFDALDGKITHASRYGRELLGIPLENLSVKEAMRQLAVYYPDGVTPMSYEDMPVTRAIQHGEIILNSELVQMTAQGNSVVLMCNAGPIRDHSGKIRGGIITWRDITEIRKIQDALRKNEYELRETDRRKNEFLAMLAHELRNPLSPIRNAVHLMRQAAAIDPFMKRQRDVIDRQVTHMARLLDDLLDVSRITRGLITLKQRPLPVLQILTQALETTQPLIASQNHTLNYTPPPPEILVYGDLDRLAQVVGNLLTNAAKYTPRGGKIRLEARLAGKEVVIRVADNGMGIEPDMLAHVFDLFAQAGRSLERSLGGLGIGLTIVNNMVRMHGGTVEARSEGPGKGSEFLVRIPAISGEFHPANETVETGTGRPEARYRILVVEDIKDTAESLAELLRFWGQEVQVAYDGQEALDKMPIFKPEIVLLDIGLPRIDGYEVARRIRRQFDQHVRIIAMSGYGQAQNQNLAEKAGIEQYWVKPVDIEVLQRYLACPPPKGDKNQA
jgi:PAS domain S-box-containing protein